MESKEILEELSQATYVAERLTNINFPTDGIKEIIETLTKKYAASLQSA